MDKQDEILARLDLALALHREQGERLRQMDERLRQMDERLRVVEERQRMMDGDVREIRGQLTILATWLQLVDQRFTRFPNDFHHPETVKPDRSMRQH